MAATVTNSGEANANTSGTTLETGAFSCTGSNTVLYAIAFCSSGAPDERAVLRHGGSGGTVMTRIGGSITVGTFNKCCVYRLISPSSSSLTVHATWPSSHDERGLIAFGVQDAHQGTPNGAIATGSGTSTSLSATATTTSGSLVIGAGTWQDGGLNQTVTAGQTSIQEIEGTDTTYNGLVVEYTTASGSTQAMTATIGSSTTWGMFAFQVNDFASSSVPIVERKDVTESGNNTATTSWAVSHAAYNSGDLVVFNVASDANVTHDWSATGPNSETVRTVYDSLGDTATANQRCSVFAYVATASRAANTFTVTPSATEQWVAASFIVPAGEFDPSNPIQTNVGTAQDSTADTSWATPAWTSDATANGRVFAFAAHDTVTTTVIPSGWGELSANDIGAVGCTLAYRELANSESESISSVNFTKTSETDCSIGYIINAPTGVPPAHVVTVNSTLYLNQQSRRPAPYIPGNRR